MAKSGYRKNNKVLIPITLHTFEAILNYLISVRNINRKFINNIINLLDVIDIQPYESNDYGIFLLTAIGFVSKIRDDGVSNLNYIKNMVEQSELDSNYVNQLYMNLQMATEDMSKEEYEHLTQVVADYLDYTYVYLARPSIMNVYDNLMNNGGKFSSTVIQELKQILETTLSKIRIADTTRGAENMICIDSKLNKSLKTEINKIYDNLNDPSNTFVVGLKELNRFLNGGFQRKRTYILYAPTNSFKSGLLLYIALWIIQFNPNIKPKFPNKKLAVLLINMENSVDETMDRIHAIFTAGQVDPRNITREQYMEQWDTIFKSLDTNFKLYIRYVTPGATSIDIQTLVDELEEDDNCEICTVIIDHLGNMGKIDKTTDDRRGTINTAYELSDWAKQSDRLLVTAMHTNSGFDDQLAEAIQNGKSNLVRMAGRHCIADAKYIDRAVDQSIYLVKERSAMDGQWYLGFKYEKMRSKKSTGSNIFYHKLENEITLRYDQGLAECFSFPFIPGSENAIQMAQNQVNGLTSNSSLISAMPPVHQNIINPVPEVFGNGNGKMSFQESMVNKKIQQPLPMSFNNSQPFNIESAGVNTPVPRVIINMSQEEIDDEDVSNLKFKDDSDELFDIIQNGVDESTNEEFYDEDFDDDDDFLNLTNVGGNEWPQT